MARGLSERPHPDLQACGMDPEGRCRPTLQAGRQVVSAQVQPPAIMGRQAWGGAGGSPRPASWSGLQVVRSPRTPLPHMLIIQTC